MRNKHTQHAHFLDRMWKNSEIWLEKTQEILTNVAVKVLFACLFLHKYHANLYVVISCINSIKDRTRKLKTYKVSQGVSKSNYCCWVNMISNKCVHNQLSEEPE